MLYFEQIPVAMVVDIHFGSVTFTVNLHLETDTEKAGFPSGGAWAKMELGLLGGGGWEWRASNNTGLLREFMITFKSNKLMCPWVF